MGSATGVAVLVAAVLLLGAEGRRWRPGKNYKNLDADIGKTGGYWRPPTTAMWTDKVARERGPPPYVPPKDWVYNTTAGPVAGKINVHLVPHTHDDTGWQVTVDQYFYREVYYIVDTVVERLLEDANRRFMYVETGFFARWWDQQPERRKNQTRMLVAEGRLEFVNGGWCMHDEASPYWVEMVDQTTRGHQFLKKHFGAKAAPKGTWQIDPFGHSNTNAWLIGAESGMDYEFWGRMDYQDFAMRKPQKRLEWIWEGSESLGSSAQIFAGELFGGGGGGYGTWIGFDGSDQQVQDDPSRHDYNVDKWVDQFVQHALEQANSTRTEHQMWACGSDFQYQNAIHWYRNLDKLIHYVNQNGTVNAFYSTPTRYVEEKRKAAATWEVRHDDIFPLADNAHHYWTGYFTSRPALKRQVHVASNFLNAARQLEVVSKTTKEEVNVPTTRPSPVVGTSWTDSLEGTVGVATHHDGMSGTEREDVSNDYELRISESHTEVEAGVALSLRKLLGTNATLSHCNCNSMGAEDCLNITVCGATTGTAEFSVVVWNPLGQNTTQVLRVPVTGEGWSVAEAGTGREVGSQTAELDERTKELPLLYLNSYKMSPAEVARWKEENSNKADHVLSFEAAVPPMGFSVYTARRAKTTTMKTAMKTKTKTTTTTTTRTVRVGDGPFEVENEYYAVTFDPATGLMTKVTNKVSGATTPLAVTWGWYNSSVGGCTSGVAKNLSCDGQKSGAYIFRPNSSELFYPGPKQVPQLRTVQGPMGAEVYQTFSEWATQVVRVWKGQPYIEVEWTAGPIPIDTPWMPPVAKDKHGHDLPNQWGKEVVVRYSSGVASKGVFYTDSNGMELIQRRYNARGPSYPQLQVNEPVAGNYYPVNSMIAVQDDENELVVITDVSQGGASLKDGEVELMVHRRLQDDDSRGVQEPLNETMCGCGDINAEPGQMGEHGHEGDGGCECAGLTMRGRHWLVFDKVEKANELRRQLAEKLSFPATLAFAGEGLAPRTPKYTALSQALPPNVKLVTLTNNYASINEGKLLLRLAHLYSTGEHPTLSQPVTISLPAVFGKAGLKLVDATETQLTAMTAIEEVRKRKAKWNTVGSAPAPSRVPLDPKTLTVTLHPMEVRTFLATFQ